MSDDGCKVTKLESAARQLREAILMFFERRDPIAVHTLAAASNQVLVDVSRSKGHASLLKDSPFIRPEKRKEWLGHLNEAANFFKHADRDPDDVLQFYPAVTPFFILDSIQIYALLTKDFPHDQRAFIAWFNAAYSDLLLEGPIKQAVVELLTSGLNPDDFAIFLKLAREQH